MFSKVKIRDLADQCAAILSVSSQVNDVGKLAGGAENFASITRRRVDTQALFDKVVAAEKFNKGIRRLVPCRITA